MLDEFVFTPIQGYRDSTFAPTDPLSEADFRDTMQDIPDQIRDYINDTIVTEIETLDSANVKLTGDQTVAGIKTFSASPIVLAPTTDLQPATKKYVDDADEDLQAQIDEDHSDIGLLGAADLQNVKLTGNQTIEGIKTFASSPIVPTPTTDTQASTKKYVDDNISAVVLGQIPNDTLTNAKLGVDIKVGSLASLTTTDKTSVVSAVNEVKASIPSAVTVDDTPVVGHTTAAASSNSVAVHLADYVRQPGYGITAGTTTAFTLTLSPVPTSYVDGMGIAIKIIAANTAACTINVNALGAKSLKDALGNDFNSGDLKINTIYSFKYDSVNGNFILQGKGGGAIKSVQRGYQVMNPADTTKDITISSVDTTKAYVKITFYSFIGAQLQDCTVNAKITSSTNIRLTKETSVNTVACTWEVKEFNPSIVKSLQRGSISSGYFGNG